MSATLWCYAHGSNGNWEAICVDFDIAVQGRSFDEVKKLLEQSIVTYIETVQDETPEVRRQLLQRRAPLHVRLSMALRFLWNATWHKKNGGDSAAGFSMPCPA